MITRDPGYFCGHSTYMEQDILFASVARVVERVNTVIGVTPVKTRYNGDFVDLVVGRIEEVQQKWGMVNINSRLDKVPILSSVNLPGGVEEEVHGGRADDEVFGGGRSHQCGGSE